MKAIVIREHGGPEVLRVEDRPAPVAGPGEVAVRVTHVGLNHLDVWVRRGVQGHRFPLPLVAGSDVAGVREDTGERVVLVPFEADPAGPASVAGRPDLDRSYRIRGEAIDGGCAERMVVPERSVIPMGDLAPAHAAALPLALLTAFHMLVGRARLQPGQTVFVPSGAGGVASLAIQIARACGARVVASASTEDKRALCRELGAEQVWSHEEAVDGVRAWTGKRGVDVVVEHVGAATWDMSLRAAARGGTVVTCGATAGHEVPLNLRVLFFKQLSLLGSTMGSWDELVRAWELVKDGRVRPVVHAVLPMTRLGDAHTLLEARVAAGKVVVEQDLG